MVSVIDKAPISKEITLITKILAVALIFFVGIMPLSQQVLANIYGEAFSKELILIINIFILIYETGVGMSSPPYNCF